ncbi:MAG TPA: adenylate/guanylate cyclase domain-containing protein [Bacteroidia bacterium]|nr:adenylate/guanylate cyclase domain-containing protein [Bacteroidia bacterium]HRS59852.1 adenylate/guanylate cyclase domain-containing protein [Bacteroidia bacterium]HRU68896.1 adenylate/guanylate cyclase domain-containing protein [Bacteroidia bacterium]
MRHFWLLSVILFVLWFRGSSQNIRYPVENFGPKEYGRNRDVQNWALAQGNDGRLYFGNANGILEYNGFSWSFIPCVNGVFVTALAFGNDGLLYVGTQYGFGCLIPDLSGKLQYYSLSDNLLDQYFNTIVWKIHVIGNHVYFQTEDAIFDYFEGKVNTLLPETSFHLSFDVNDQLIVRVRDRGLFRLNNKSWVKIEGSEIFAQTGIFSVLPFPGQTGHWLIFTQGNGIWEYKSGKFSTVRSDFDALFNNSVIYGGIVLHDRQIAINTSSNGVLITDFKLDYIHIINSLQSGISVNDIKQVMEDRHGNLWCATNNGISKISYSSPVGVYDKKNGISSNVYCITVYQGKIYVGTSNGILAQKDREYIDFEAIPNIKESVWVFHQSGNSLLIGGNEKFYCYDGKHIETIGNHNVRSIVTIPELNLVITGGLNGIDFYRNINKNWKKVTHTDEINTEIIGLAIEKTGNNMYRLWAGTLFNGLYSVSFSEDLTFNINQFGAKESLPEGFCIPFHTGEKVVFGTNNGIYSFKDIKGKDKDTKALLENILIFGMDIHKPVNTLARKGNQLYISLTDHVLYFKDGKYDGKPLAGVDAGKIRTVFIENENITWFGCDDGLIRYDNRKYIPNANHFKTFITSVLCNPDSVIYFGNSFKGMEKPVLKFSENSLSVFFSSDFYHFPEQIMYSYFLEGIDKDWSPWTTDHKAIFSHLPEGSYTFRVKARNVFDYESSEAVYRFTVLPPWYRTTPAYIAYFIGLIIIIFIIVRISNYRIRQKNIRLEKIVQERTAEIAAKNVILQEQKEQIEKEKAKSEALLLNTLPAKVVEELKAKGFTEPESFENVTVYFSDIKGFTEMSGGLDPKYLISKLNEMFTAFDDIMTKYNCERIKTIGDAYMAVCGLPQKQENHAEQMALAAIDILRYLKERNKKDELPISIRIGLNSGKVTGGIVGVRKYIYDVFGDTVNTASRMESNGEPMRINVSETTYLLLKDKFRFEERPPLEVKGKGVLKMYFLNWEESEKAI